MQEDGVAEISVVRFPGRSTVRSGPRDTFRGTQSTSRVMRLHLPAQASELQILLVKLVTEPRYGCYSGIYSRLNSEHDDPVTYITFVLQLATLTTNYDAVKRASAGNITTSCFMVTD